MRVIGVDPGSRKIGLAVVDGTAHKTRAVAWTTKYLRSDDAAARLQAIYGHVREWVEEFAPARAAVEEVFVSRNAKSALILGQARGVALLAMADAEIPVEGYPPAKIKKAIGGHGRAGKAEIRRMVRLQLELDHDPPEDAADALAVAMTDLATSWTRSQVELAW